MKIMFLSYMDFLGAGNAAKKIFKMLDENGIDIDFFVKKKNSELSKKIDLKFDEKVHDAIFDFLNYSSNKFLNNKFGRRYNPYHKSLGWFNSPYPKIINKTDYDIIHLNWVNNFLSIDDIVKINKPIVWRFSDMWPILGINHYSNNYSINSLYSKIDKISLKKKDKFKNKNFNVVAPSKWMESEIRKKKISENWSINTIYTPIDDNIFIPIGKNKIESIKDKYNINKTDKVLCFCADDINENRKGLHKIIDIFKKNLIDEHNFTLLTIGKGETKNKKINNLTIKNLGYINSQIDINEIFNISDLLILFSDIDNLPQVGLEAQMSGLPIVTYNHSGMSEIIENNVTGFYVNDDSESVVKNLKHFFNTNKNNVNYRGSSRKRSLSLWSKNIIYKKYLILYENILNEKKN